MFEGRDYQQEALDAVASEQYRNFLLGWHRRAGKDRTGLEIGREEALRVVGTYWHLFPTQAQARDAIWDGINRQSGKRIMDEAFPPEIVARRSDNRTALWLTNGSKWQMRGSDDYDKLVGGECQGAIFSEFDLTDPAALTYVAPIVAESGGWLAFITTFRNKWRAYRLAQLNRNNPDWYVDIRSIDDTKRADGSPVVTHAEVERIIASGLMTRSKAQQEFFMDPGAVAEHAYLEDVLAQALAA